MIITYIHTACPEDQTRVQLRCRNFADAINRTRSHHAHLLELNAFLQNTAEAEKLCAASDLLVIHRYVFGPVLRAIQYWKARDKKVIVDFDQALNYMTPGMPGHAFWLEGKISGGCGPGAIDWKAQPDELPLEQFKWGLGMLDAATVSSSRLADDWAQYTRIHEIPEYLNTYQYPALEHVRGQKIWMGLGCINSGFASLEDSGLLKALEHVCRKRPQVRLAWNIPQGDLPRPVEIDPAQFHVFSRDSFEAWVNILLKLDLGLFPVSGSYDQRLSPANLLEFMISKIPWISSGNTSFHEYSPYGVMVTNSPEAWEQAILKIVDQIDLHQKKAAREPFLFALGQDISVNIDKVLKVYTAIIKQDQ